VTTNNYLEISEKEFLNQNDEEDLNYSNEKIIGSSNKEIYQSENAQKLTDEEILNLKETIENKDELIKTLIENNSSMEKRTIFSQEKIIKKKVKKYKHLIHLLPTNLFNIIETFFLTDIKVINFLRMDSIATMLLNSNFQPNQNTLILEETSNILTQAFALRTNFKSKIIQLFKDKISNKYLNIFNLSFRQKGLISQVNIDCFLNENNFWYKIYNNKYKESFSNLVICLKNDYEISKYFFTLFDYLKFSGNFIIFAKDKEILLSIDKNLYENKLSIDNKIIETITREYQILELRTHPMMNNKGYSGYILTGYKCAPNE
jgi:tRNA (adenine-N(1)-)-methyltransferase non-catalytic subunit